jgi:hypothetical protein
MAVTILTKTKPSPLCTVGPVEIYERLIEPGTYQIEHGGEVILNRASTLRQALRVAYARKPKSEVHYKKPQEVVAIYDFGINKERYLVTLIGSIWLFLDQHGNASKATLELIEDCNLLLAAQIKWSDLPDTVRVAANNIIRVGR